MRIVDPREVVWLSVEVSTCDEKGDVTMKLRFRLRRHPKTPWRANLGLRSVVGRSAGNVALFWAVAATAAKVSQQGKACLEGLRFLPGAPLTIRSSPRAPPTP